MQDLEKPAAPEWLIRLKHGRVFPFTKSQDFLPNLTEVFDLIQKQVIEDRSRYSQDWVSVGLPGLANGCIRKASRVYDLFVMDMPGKDKPEDELRDNMMLGIYSYMYYKMMVEGPRSVKEVPQVEIDIPTFSPSVEVPITPKAIETIEVQEPQSPSIEESKPEGLSEPQEELEVQPQGSNFLGKDMEDPNTSKENEEENKDEEDPEEPPKKSLTYI